MVDFSTRFLEVDKKTVDLVSNEELKTSASIYLLVDEDIGGVKSNREKDLSHVIVTELGPSTKFAYASHKAVSEYKEAKAVCCCNNKYSQLFVI
ncbi:uncharacterized protein [Miscanthus floridulus]|uniref:uncharacterized protein isoform X3 n=1 Tax=Miscanthus floridulus TaxID=154761 RepID=UPI00345880A3